MVLFDHIDTMIQFMHDNLPEKIKYEFLYEMPSFKPRYPSEDFNEKYGNPIVPYVIFLNLCEYGYAFKIVSGETFNISFEKEKYILMWSRIKEAITESTFLAKDIEQYRLISINEACKLLGLTRPSIYKILNQNEIPVVQIFDKTKRIQLKDLIKYIEQKKQT